jgi:hypothetical protein
MYWYNNTLILLHYSQLHENCEEYKTRYIPVLVFTCERVILKWISEAVNCFLLIQFPYCYVRQGLLMLNYNTVLPEIAEYIMTHRPVAEQWLGKHLPADTQPTIQERCFLWAVLYSLLRSTH